MSNTIGTILSTFQPKGQLKNPMEISPLHSTDPPIGLHYLDVSNKAYLRIKASIDNPPKTAGASAKATVHLDAWDDTVLLRAGCSWLDVCKHDRDFQFGSSSTGKLNANQKKTSTPVKFDKPYASAPNVVVCFKELDVANDAHCRVNASASEITAKGFTLTIETWDDTTVHAATATWIAYPSTRSNIQSGNFHPKNTGTVEKPQVQNCTNIKFEKKFERDPYVFVALNCLDISKDKFMRVKTFTKDVKPESMELHIESWDDTVMFSVGACWLAIQEY